MKYWSIPTAGEDPEEPSGPETGCLSQILGLRLGNRGNFCYSNAVVRSWLHLAAWLGGLQQLFEGNMLAHLKGLMQAKGVIHMWSNPFWRAQMGKWRNPHMQHDVAEFLTHALSRLPSAMIRLATPWQARTRGTFWRVQDQGPSVPLVIQPSELAGTESLGMQTVQGMIEAWHNQRMCMPWSFGPRPSFCKLGVLTSTQGATVRLSVGTPLNHALRFWFRDFSTVGASNGSDTSFAQS